MRLTRGLVQPLQLCGRCSGPLDRQSTLLIPFFRAKKELSLKAKLSIFYDVHSVLIYGHEL